MFRSLRLKFGLRLFRGTLTTNQWRADALFPLQREIPSEDLGNARKCLSHELAADYGRAAVQMRLLLQRGTFRASEPSSARNLTNGDREGDSENDADSFVTIRSGN